MSIALISMGLAMATLPLSDGFAQEDWFLSLLPQVLWLAAGALIGTGIMLPFAKPAAGAIIGFLFQVVLFYTCFIPIERLF